MTSQIEIVLEIYSKQSCDTGNQLIRYPLTSLRGRGGRESWSWRRTSIYGSGKTSALVDRYWPAFTHKPSRPTMALYTRFALRSCAFSQSLLLTDELLAHFSLFRTNCTLSHIARKFSHQHLCLPVNLINFNSPAILQVPQRKMCNKETQESYIMMSNHCHSWFPRQIYEWDDFPQGEKVSILACLKVRCLWKKTVSTESSTLQSLLQRRQDE